jgi:iron only hydrogenase large subunit-like protein
MLKRPELVPHVSFVDIPQQMEILKDWQGRSMSQHNL